MEPSSSKYFSKTANLWDDLRAGYFTEAVRQTAISKAFLRKEMIVADVGAGTGFMTEGLAPLVQQVHVLDGSPEMITVARRNLAAFENVIYHTADGQALSLPDASVDVVFANMYLHHCSNPLDAIREMVRILKPGGRLVITDLDSHSFIWLKEEMADVWTGFDREQIRQWFKDVDLVNTIIDCSGQLCCAESQDHSLYTDERKAEIGIFVATATRRMQRREAVKDAYGARAEWSGSCCGSKNLSELEIISIEEGAGCCSPASASLSCCSAGQYLPTQSVIFATDYTHDEKAIVPAEAEEISLGCGNPTAFARLQPGETVLDIGSGGGMDSFLAANRVGPTGKVIGVDMTPAMLTRARETAARSNVTNVEFRQGQAEALPVDTDSIDVVISNCVINLCEDKGLVFQEAYRVLTPGGRLEVSDMVTNGPLSLHSRSDTNEWSGCVSGALPEQEYLALTAQAGFINIQARRSTSAGYVDDVAVYSVTVSAQKPAAVIS